MEEENQSDGQTQQPIVGRTHRGSDRSHLNKLFTKEDEELELIAASDEDERMNAKYERTRGVASSQLYRVQNRDSEEEEEEDDPEAYKYPKINKEGASTMIFDLEDDEENSSVDLESQQMKPMKPQQICYVGAGAVGKLKALRSSRASAVASNSNRVVYQNTPTFLRSDTNFMRGNNEDDSEEVYESDFEDESYK